MDQAAYQPTARTKLVTLWRQAQIGRGRTATATATNLFLLSPPTIARVLKCVLGRRQPSDAALTARLPRRWIVQLWTLLERRSFPMQLLAGLPVVPVLQPAAVASAVDSDSAADPRIIDPEQCCVTALQPLRHSTVMHMRQLPPLALGALQQLGVMTYDDSIDSAVRDAVRGSRAQDVLTSVATFAVHAASPLGAVRALLNRAERLDIRGLVAGLSDKEKAVLFQLVRDAYGLSRQKGGPPDESSIFREHANTLRGLPLFPCCRLNSLDPTFQALPPPPPASESRAASHSHAGVVKCCLDVEVAAGTAPPSLLALPRPVHQFDRQLLEGVLGVPCVSFPQACVFAVLPHLAELKASFAVAASEQALRSLGNNIGLWRSHPDALAFLQRHPFIPVAQEPPTEGQGEDRDQHHPNSELELRTPRVRVQFARAVDLYEPQERPLYTNNVGESFRMEDILPTSLFPHPRLIGQPALVSGLRHLGIRTSLQRHDILYAAKHMASPSQVRCLRALIGTMPRVLMRCCIKPPSSHVLSNSACLFLFAEFDSSHHALHTRVCMCVCSVQAANLLAYLDSHFDRYFVDTSTVSLPGSTEDAACTRLLPPLSVTSLCHVLRGRACVCVISPGEIVPRIRTRFCQAVWRGRFSQEQDGESQRQGRAGRQLGCVCDRFCSATARHCVVACDRPHLVARTSGWH